MKAIKISDMVFLYLAILSIVRQVWQVGTQLLPFVEGLGQCHKGLSIFNDDMRLTNINNTNVFSPKDDSIEFRNVTLYENNKCILNNVSFFIKDKEKVALLGKSGSGKTTLLKVILSLTSPYEGDVFIGGVNIKNVNSNEIRNYCGLLDQKHYWFDRSIKENLLYGNPTATDKELKEVCEKASIYQFIQDLPEKWHTVANMNTLSGGQVQRLCFARLLIRKTKIMMCDELSNGLDVSVQKFLGNFIDEYKGTCLLTTHNLYYRKIFHRLIIIENGKIIDTSTHSTAL